MRQIEHKSVPDIRFPGFDKPWALQKVGDFVSEHREKSKQDNQHEVLTSSRAGLKPQSEYFGENRLTERDNTGFNVIPPNYITYRSRSDNREFFFNENNLGIHGIISVYYPVFRISGGNNQFFTELLNSKRHHVGRYSVGTSQTVLSLNDLRSIRFPIPCEDEQRKIAGVLGAVDERIAQVTRKKALLEDYKKGCMQQLFSQSIRFKDDQGNDFPDWEEKRLGEVASVVGGGTPDSAVENYWGGDVQWFTPSEIKMKYLTKSARTISQSGLKKSSAKLLPVGTLLLSTRATVGDVGIATEECCTNQGFQSLVVNPENYNEFWYYWLVMNKRELLRRASGSTFLEIGKSEILKIKGLRPHPDEQQKIADFLSAVDTKIDLVTQELEQAKTFKKGLLQQMFV